MQVVILAAGKGTRMGALSSDLPKPMIKVGTRNLIEHKLDLLPITVTEIIIVVGYKAEVIKDYFGSLYKGRTITYIDQHEPLGTGHALWKTKDHITGQFLVMMGDDIYTKESIEAVLKYPFAMTVKRSPSFKKAGNVIANADGTLNTIEFDREGTRAFVSMDTCLYSLSPEIFTYPLAQVHGRDEWGLPQTLVSMAHEIPIKVLETDFWIKINTPEEVILANAALEEAEIATRTREVLTTTKTT